MTSAEAVALMNSLDALRLSVDGLNAVGTAFLTWLDSTFWFFMGALAGKIFVEGLKAFK
ncbi:MAG: hypothetical protein HZA04_02560 [Nitrospinae bacterium]|nr:hypothetical protein [Nitrospinota bacterium]